MTETRFIMGMPICVSIVDADASRDILEQVFAFFAAVDHTFSTYRKESEISKINRHELSPQKWSKDMQEMFTLAAETHRETEGFFDIVTPSGSYDPSGLVKGWAIRRAARMLRECGCKNFYVDAGGDIAAEGANEEGVPWSVGIRNPFNHNEIVKVIYPRGAGIATSGTYIRGEHIYDPHAGAAVATPYVSITVIGPDVYEADRFATAAFAMGKQGLSFIESLPGFEAYAIDANATATMTSGFEPYTRI